MGTCSPAELLMGWELRTTVPVSPELLQPKVPEYSSFASKKKATGDKQKRNFDKRHKARQLNPLAPGDSVWIPSIHVEGTVKKEVAPRSYQVSTSHGSLRRNRQHLRPIPSAYTSFDGNHSEDIQLQESTPTLPHPESIPASTSGLTETATSQSATGTSLPRA